MAVILLQSLIAVSAFVWLIVLASFVLIPFVTLVWSEVVIHRRKPLTRAEQVKVIGLRLLYTVGMALLIWFLLFVSVHLMDFSIT